MQDEAGNDAYQNSHGAAMDWVLLVLQHGRQHDVADQEDES